MSGSNPIPSRWRGNPCISVTTCSSKQLQRQRIGLLRHHIFWRLLAVNTLLCERVPTKNLHCGSVFDFQMGHILILQKFCCKLNFVSTAWGILSINATIHLQEIMSSKSFSSCMLLMAWHRETNFLTSSPRTKGRIELDPIVVSKSFDLNTEMFFLFAFLYDLGAMFLGASPSTQPDR